MINFNEIKGFICDMDGVIYRGNQIIPGVREFIDWLHAENKKFLFRNTAFRNSYYNSFGFRGFLSKRKKLKNSVLLAKIHL